MLSKIIFIPVINKNLMKFSIDFADYCERGYFPWGEILRLCRQDVRHGYKLSDLD